MAATAVISAAGLHRGIEIGNKIMMPGLFGILLALAIYAMVQGDAPRALAFLTQLDFSQLSGELVLAAVGQAFFATGVGMAIMIAYGSHVAATTSVPRSAAIVTCSIILASVLSSLLIFPLVFGFDVDPAQGPQLAFIVMPSIFIDMPAGGLIGTLFFLLLGFAALSSSIAGLEPTCAWLMERFGMKRIAAVSLVAAVTWLLGLATVLSFNHWSELHPLAAIVRFRTSTVFDLLDYFASNILLPVGALLTSLFVGWRLERSTTAADFGASPAIRTLLRVLLRYLCPVVIIGVLVSAI
jgi:NSS family neurotransmitter:Na+ symporter